MEITDEQLLNLELAYDPLTKREYNFTPYQIHNVVLKL